jgi:exopolyphosphatase/guanosine-5'-triphosphate,3'-diphosphate pyrophosphatase
MAALRARDNLSFDMAEKKRLPKRPSAIVRARPSSQTVRPHRLISERLFSRRLAAIDIGSNAIRMILAEQNHDHIQVLDRFRYPLRLGTEVFKNGKLSDKTIKAAAKTFKEFSKMAHRLRVRTILAVGTSALREAKNSGAFIKAVKKASSIHVKVIDGVEEARLVHLAVKNQIQLNRSKALLIDVGGGSIELTFSERGLMSATQSFPFGTVRTLQLLKDRDLKEADLEVILEQYLGPLTHFIQTKRRFRPRIAVGTGGNVETLARLKTKLLNSNDHEMITIHELEEIIVRLRELKIKERVKKLDLRPDRADVIVPAALLVHAALSRAKISTLCVPHVGLREGLLWQMANRNWK